MNWNIFKKKKEKRSYNNGFDFLTYNCVSSYAESKAMLLSAVYRCVEVISDSIAQLPLEPYKTDSKGYKVKFTNHPSYHILNCEPNKNMTKYTFMKVMVRSMLLQGNAYAYIERDDKGNAKALYYLQPDMVTVKVPTRIADDIKYSVVGFPKDLERDEVLHILNYTIDGYEGISTLANARNTLMLASDAEANAEGFFKGGANVGGILKVNSPMTDEDKLSMKQSWNSSFNGINGNPNGVAVLDADVTYQPVTVNPTDSQLLETRQFNVIDICRFFGVSPVKAFDLSKSSYNTIEQMQIAFLTDTLQPLLKKFEEEFNRKIFKPSERCKTEIRFSTAPLLRADKQSLANYYNTLFQIGVITPNEIRKELDMQALDNGDNSFVQVNVQTLKTATSDKPDNSNTIKEKINNNQETIEENGSIQGE